MKKSLLSIVLVAYSLVCLSQTESKYTLGIDANYLYYARPAGKGITDNFNYGFSILMTDRIGEIRIGIGINLSTYNFTEDQNYAYKVVQKVKYINFPLLIFFNSNSAKLVKISPYAGIIANNAIRYDRVIYNPDKAPVYENNKKIPVKFGFSGRAGVNVSKSIGKHMVFNAAPFVDLKIVSNSDYHSLHYDRLDSAMSLGFRVGFEYVI